MQCTSNTHSVVNDLASIYCADFNSISCQHVVARTHLELNVNGNLLCLVLYVHTLISKLLTLVNTLESSTAAPVISIVFVELLFET